MAGSEAAWQAANLGVHVTVHEMRPQVGTFAHQTGLLAEMVCSNSFRSDDDEQNAVGLLHWEMRQAGGLIMEAADTHKLPAGGALAVDRDAFAEWVTQRLHDHPNITVDYGEIDALPGSGSWIIATGPLTSSKLAQSIAAQTGADQLAFFDAIAPIVYFDSIDMGKAWMQSRYDKGDTEEERTAYLNCPMTKDQYEAFIDALLAADKTEFHEGETAGYFDGCLPIEVMADRGRETLRFGPMKPVGPHQSEHKPDRQTLCRGPAAPRQRLGHALQHRRLPDENEIRRADRGLQNDPGPWKTPALPASAASTATHSSTRQRCWTTRCA